MRCGHGDGGIREAGAVPGAGGCAVPGARAVRRDAGGGRSEDGDLRQLDCGVRGAVDGDILRSMVPRMPADEARVGGFRQT